MPDEARDGRNVAFELSSDLLVCSIVQRNHSTIHIYCKAILQRLNDPKLECSTIHILIDL